MKRRIAGATLLVLGVATLLLGARVAHRIVDSTRGTPLETLRDDACLDVAPAIRDAAFLSLLELLAGASITGGNAVDLLTGADSSYGLLYADLRAARRSISLQAYYCLPGRVADTLAAILADRARAGVQVLVLGDGYGCRLFLSRHGAVLRAAGVRVAALRPLRWYTMHDAQHRSHVRLVVVDGEIAYTGGFGVDDKWLYGSATAAAWRDTNVRARGAVVRQMQAAFAVAWAEATRELVVGSAFFQPADSAVPGAHVRAGVQFAGPGFGTTPFERLALLTIAGARARLYIANAYFLPNRAQRRLLADAARRGVDVRVLTAGDRSDVPSTRFASRAHYAELLAAGVRIFEYMPTMMHAKTLVADGRLAVVGTMNFDNRSMRLGDELNLLVYDSSFAWQLEESFAVDVSQAAEVSASAHAARPLRERVLERLARLVEPLM